MKLKFVILHVDIDCAGMHVPPLSFTQCETERVVRIPSHNRGYAVGEANSAMSCSLK